MVYETAGESWPEAARAMNSAPATSTSSAVTASQSD